MTCIYICFTSFLLFLHPCLQSPHWIFDTSFLSLPFRHFFYPISGHLVSPFLNMLQIAVSPGNPFHHIVQIPSILGLPWVPTNVPHSIQDSVGHWHVSCTIYTQTWHYRAKCQAPAWLQTWRVAYAAKCCSYTADFVHSTHWAKTS